MDLEAIKIEIEDEPTGSQAADPLKTGVHNLPASEDQEASPSIEKEDVEPKKIVEPDVYNKDDVDRYYTKKLLAAGMMDLALLAANSNQLRYILERPEAPSYSTSLGFITGCIACEMMVLTFIIINSSVSVHLNFSQNRTGFAHFVNNMITIGIIIISAINGFCA